MKTITLDEAKKIKFNNASVALGTFDGLHKGHMELINAAKKHKGDTIAFTFDALPMDIFQSKHKPMQLFTMKEKIESFKKTGIDYLCVAHFDRDFAGIEKLDFEKLLVEAFSPSNIIAGYNYTFGKHAEGTVDVLRQDSGRLGYNVQVIDKVIVNSAPVSSTKIRELIWNGEIEKANILLGYNYSLSGVVEYGKGIGEKLGFKTANIGVSKEKIVPKNGVYSVDVFVDDKEYKGVCNIGVNPTVSESGEQTIETHILGFDQEIYNNTIKVSFKKRIRNEMRFENKQLLAEQIKKDAETALA